MRSLLKKIFRQIQDTKATFRTSVFRSNSATQPLGSENCYSINKTFKRLSSTTLSSMPSGEASPRPLGYALGNTQTLLACVFRLALATFEIADADPYQVDCNQKLMSDAWKGFRRTMSCTQVAWCSYQFWRCASSCLL